MPSIASEGPQFQLFPDADFLHMSPLVIRPHPEGFEVVWSRPNCRWFDDFAYVKRIGWHWHVSSGYTRPFESSKFPKIWNILASIIVVPYGYLSVEKAKDHGNHRSLLRQIIKFKKKKRKRKLGAKKYLKGSSKRVDETPDICGLRRVWHGQNISDDIVNPQNGNEYQQGLGTFPRSPDSEY